LRARCLFHHRDGWRRRRMDDAGAVAGFGANTLIQKVKLFAGCRAQRWHSDCFVQCERASRRGCRLMAVPPILPPRGMSGPSTLPVPARAATRPKRPLVMRGWPLLYAATVDPPQTIPAA
jgi:hypothetical protein